MPNTYIVKNKDQFSQYELDIHKFFCDKVLDKIPNNNFWIAGGSIRSFIMGMDITDFDIYSRSRNDSNEIKHHFIQKEADVIRTTENSTLFLLNGEKFDVIERHIFGNLGDCIRQFDFTCCCCAISKDQICYNENYFDHVSSRSLLLNTQDVNDCGELLPRMQKYIKMGFTVPNDEFDKMTQIIKSSKKSNRKKMVLSTQKDTDAKIDLDGLEYDKMGFTQSAYVSDLYPVRRELDKKLFSGYASEIYKEYVPIKWEHARLVMGIK